MVRDVTAALDVLPLVRYPLPNYDPLITNLAAVLVRIALTSPLHPLAGRTLLSPIASPGKISLRPVNYQTHLDEFRSDKALHHKTAAHTVNIQTAGLFLKANSSLVGAGEGVIIRIPDRRTDHEVELAVVIGKHASQVSRAGLKSGTSRHHAYRQWFANRALEAGVHSHGWLAKGKLSRRRAALRTEKVDTSLNVSAQVIDGAKRTAAEK